MVPLSHIPKPEARAAGLSLGVGAALMGVKPDTLHLYDMPPADEPLKIAFRDLL